MKPLMDVDYLAFAVLMGVFGVVGITATASVTPNIFASSTCNCIPSPAARLQVLSVILLGFGLVLAPIGLMRRRVGATGVPQVEGMTPSGGEMTPSMRSGGLFFLGISLVVFGIALVAIPSFLVLGNRLLVGEGAAMVVLGALLAYRGGRSS